MKKLYCLVTIIMMTAVNLFAEPGINDLTIQQFLQTAEKDFSVENLNEQTEAFIDASLNTPFFDRVEAITESSEFDLEKQRYALRFYPKGWGERKYSKNILEAQKALDRFEYNVKFNNAVKFRYDLALEYLEISSLLEINKKRMSLLNGHIETLNVKTQLSSYLEAEETLIGINLMQVDLQNRKTGVISRIHTAAATTATIYFDKEILATFDNLNEIVSEISSKDSTVNATLSKKQNGIDLLNNQYLLGKAKNKNYISYIQGNFDTDNAPDFEKTYSFKLAVKLPFINSGREELTSLKRKHMEAKLSFLEARQAVSEEKKKLTRELQRYQRQLKVLLDVKKKRNSMLSNETLSKNDRFKLKHSIITTDQQIVSLDAKIRSVFIQLVDLAGELSVSPLVNYIVHST